MKIDNHKMIIIIIKNNVKIKQQIIDKIIIVDSSQEIGKIKISNKKSQKYNLVNNKLKINNKILIFLQEMSYKMQVIE
jgi:hypothetical protein